jgi:proteasome lid subunit RPN8/RPN11
MIDEVLIAEDTVDIIVQESKKFKNIETGGLIFGRKINTSAIILKIINLPNATRNQIYFEIDEELAINETRKMEKRGFEYLGNWHKHLGYGGPSIGDDNQAEIFLISNTHKQIYISLIIDFDEDETFDLIGTVYFITNSIFTKKQIKIRRMMSWNEIDDIIIDKKPEAYKLVKRSINLEKQNVIVMFQNFANKLMNYRSNLFSSENK